MDLDSRWEKKALIGLAIVTIIIVAYVYGSSGKTFNSKIQDPDVTSAVVPATTSIQQTVPTVTNNTTTDNNTTVVNNGTFMISEEEAKKIASQTGYTAGQPTKGTITVNNSIVSVWIVPIMNSSVVSKEIYVDSFTGIIIGTKEVRS